MPIWVRAALFILVMPGAIAGWLPWYVAGAGAARPAGGATSRAIAAGLIALGWAVLLWCTREFVRRGRGTPNPSDPPRALVTSGLFAYVRNPMYVAVLTAIGGWALWYRSAAVAVYGACVALGFHLRVVLYEEPRLAREFGAAYDEYRRAVRRWIPRLSAR